MRPYDLVKFQTIMASLAEVFGKQISQPLADLYWDALRSLTIEQLQDTARGWIRIGKHFPKPGELLERYREDMQAAPKPWRELPPDDPKWLRYVNGLFLKYTLRRRQAEMFRGDIDIARRRKACLDLAAFFEQHEVEFGAEATLESDLKIKFDAAMAAIPDLSQNAEVAA